MPSCAIVKADLVINAVKRSTIVQKLRMYCMHELEPHICDAQTRIRSSAFQKQK
jgi:hypothetical protein